MATRNKLPRCQLKLQDLELDKEVQMIATRSKKRRAKGVTRKRLSSLKPSPENDELYRPVDANDPEIQKLADSIKRKGILEPLCVTRDNYIVSGHRRYTAATVAGQVTVPCRVLNVSRERMDKDKYVELLREHNRQRDKSLQEKLREELVSVDPHQAYRSLIDHRQQLSLVDVSTVRIEGEKRRSNISKAKLEMLAACKRIIMEDRRDYWPMSVRTVHYALLNNPPLRNTGNANSRYTNNQRSYKNLSNLLTRARLIGIIPWEAITDETRPRAIWEVWPDPRGFIRDEFNGFLKGYWRDLMQSQPHHVEVIVEKNTAWPIVKDIAMRYRIPTTSGRGFPSIEPYRDIAERFWTSGKDSLFLLVVSDFDPEGEEIVQVAGRTLRDDFGVDDWNLELIKVAVTPQQIADLELPPNLEAKETSSRFAKFVERHGRNVYELEALTPEQLQDALTEAIDGVIDLELFNGELDAEKNDATFLQGVRNTVTETLKELKID
ncbi:MAG: chromosome partitioning protein ParB [Planctomycetaceae bacterium]|nr:chromosome partitioning protein ParB [Planctomycetaceae bacterium]